MTFSRLCLAVSAAALLATPALAQDAAAPAAAAWTPIQGSGDVVATLQASGKFTQFLSAMQGANLTSILKQQPNITVFAPTDEAFYAQFPGNEIEQMRVANQLQPRMTYLIVGARVPSSAITGSAGPAPTVSGQSIYLDGTKTPAMVNDAHILQADVQASNGVIHVLDQVPAPGFTPAAPAAAAAPAG
ncbi:MAG: fasciclin domain-containing protein [Caulobacteraceae bacterium]